MTMPRIIKKTLCFLMSLSLVGCDKPSGYEEQLAASTEWPQSIEGTFYLIDADDGDGTYATWAIGTFEPAGTDESILIEFKGNTLKEAGIDLNFDYPDPLSILVNKPIKMYFQVVSIENARKKI